uniref:Pecanex-like protein n=1 Tax=Soboliphyme baturini TaxID=241478 RepID=A0A183IFS5_9BILA
LKRYFYFQGFYYCCRFYSEHLVYLLLRTPVRFRSMAVLVFFTNSFRERIYHTLLHTEYHGPHASPRMSRTLKEKPAHQARVYTPKHFYRLSLLRHLGLKTPLKIYFDRLQLMSLFDKNKKLFSVFFDILLAVAVSVMATLVIEQQLYHDFQLLVLCWLVASAHFSLLKSVQPDASSPIHGYNALITYNRPFYFWAAAAETDTHSCISCLFVDVSVVATILESFFVNFLLFLPVIFTFGLLPQVDTFLCHVLEQVEMHVFGGTATVDLPSAFFCCIRSLVCVAALGALALVSMLRRGFPQNMWFSAFCGSIISIAYVLSRSSSGVKEVASALSLSLSTLLRRFNDKASLVEMDPAREPWLSVFLARTRSTLLTSLLLGLLGFALHCSSVFNVFSSFLLQAVPCATLITAVLAHYLLPHLREHFPWLLLAHPFLKTYQYSVYDNGEIAQLVWFERLYAYLNVTQRYVLYPALLLSIMTAYATAVLALAGLKLLRTAYRCPAHLLAPLMLTMFVTYLDQRRARSQMLVTLYVLSMIYPKFREMVLKLKFIIAYVAPWQISWGSAFHAFAQPTAVSHSAFTLAIVAVSSLISAPLNPFLGSSIFLMSYMRPVKFWEKDYNTKRIDHSNTRLVSHIDRGPTVDDSNLNAIFYEHLTRSLAGELMLGRWPTEVEAGDCFILASFYLNCMVHVIEIGNGFVTFQLRGLEFRGTYCQQREVEAITEDLSEGDGCCCCDPVKFVLEGYSVTDNSAVSTLQMIELRQLMVTLYVKCIIYYAVHSKKLTECASSSSGSYVDVDATFCFAHDEDYDVQRGGACWLKFRRVYHPWLQHCMDKAFGQATDQTLVPAFNTVSAFCFLLSLLGRRVLGNASQSRHTASAESFLYGLLALFKGDFRITSVRDEWVFADVDILTSVISPAVRMAVKLHQDHFTYADDFDDPACIYDIIENDKEVFISHENDPNWRRAVLSNTERLLALRHVFEDGQDDFKVIMLTKRHVNFRVIKLNRECVRAFWAGQQQELIFLRNRNPERGSIQNARQVLRNMINSSADQPIGYPIFVSPLTTSYSESHPQLASVLGPPLTFKLIFDALYWTWNRLKQHCSTSGSVTVQSCASQRRSLDPTVSTAAHESANPPSYDAVLTHGNDHLERRHHVFRCRRQKKRFAEEHKSYYLSSIPLPHVHVNSMNNSGSKLVIHPKSPRPPSLPNRSLSLLRGVLFVHFK